MNEIRLREGFVGQKQWVIPRTHLVRWMTHPLLQTLMPTDIGWYPNARYHYREREQGAEQYILIFCRAGSGWYEINGIRHSVNTNDALIIPRDTPHIYGASDSAPWSIQWVHFIGSEAKFLTYYLPLNHYTIPLDATCVQQVTKLFEECYEAMIGGFVLHRLLFCAQIVHHLLGSIIFNNGAFSPTQRTSQFRSLQPTITFLHENFDKNMTLGEMAAHAGLSTSHFSALFKQQTGYSPIHYFLHLKMQHAGALLSLTKKPIHQISSEVGFDDPYYFSRIFKKIMGVSPRQYRETPAKYEPK